MVNLTPRFRIGYSFQSNVRNLLALVICFIFLAAFAAIAWTAWLGKCATYDEPLHFMGAWIQTHCDDFRCNPEDPPLWKFYVAAGTSKNALKMDRKTDEWRAMLNSIPLPSLVYAVHTLYDTPGNDNTDALIRRGRARMLLLAVILGAAIAWWAWRLAGPLAAVVAAAAFCFDPNFLAHSPLVKNNVAITLTFLLIMASIWLIGERATLLRLLCAALLVGIALNVKFSGLLALPMIAIALACRALMRKPWPFLKWTLATRPARFSAACAILIGCVAVGYASIWACYGFRFRPGPNPGEKFNYYRLTVYVADAEMVLRQNPPPLYPSNAQLQQWVDQWRPSRTFRAVLFANKHKLLPQAWLYGFLYTYASLAGEALLSVWPAKHRRLVVLFPAGHGFQNPPGHACRHRYCRRILALLRPPS